MSLVDITETERRIADRVDSGVTRTLAVGLGGMQIESMAQVLEMAKLMSVSRQAVPPHLRGNPGSCLAITLQALEWRMSPFAVANKSYSVNDRIAYESQLVQAVILQRAPIRGRIKFKYRGEGQERVCTATATLADGTGELEYDSPPFGKIQPKNSPLWKNDPDQQQAYYSGRALCRRYFPDVLLGIYDMDEIEARTVDVAPAAPAPRTLEDKLDALASAGREPSHDAETAEIIESAAGSAPAAADAGAETSPSPTATEAAPASDSAPPTGPAAGPAGGPAGRDDTIPHTGEGAGRQPSPDTFPGDLPDGRSPEDIAYDRGAEAFRKNMSRRACPGELRTTERHQEALAWARGFDEAAAQAKGA